MPDIRRLDIPLLLAFEALLEEGNVGRAAARLGLTQSTVSGALARMRETLGDPLFVRHSRGLTPTARAQALRAPLAEALAALRRLAQAEDEDPARTERTVRIRATDYAQAVVLAPALPALVAGAPYASFRAEPLSGRERFDPSEGEAADLVVGTPALLPEGFPARRLFSDTLVLASAPGHPLTAHGTPGLAALASAPHLLVTLGGARLRSGLDERLAEAGLARRVAATTPSFLLAPRLLAGTSLVCVLPARLAALFEGALATAPLPVALPPIELWAAWPRRLAADRVSRFVRARILAAARST